MNGCGSGSSGSTPSGARCAERSAAGGGRGARAGVCGGRGAGGGGGARSMCRAICESDERGAAGDGKAGGGGGLRYAEPSDDSPTRPSDGVGAGVASRASRGTRELSGRAGDAASSGGRGAMNFGANIAASADPRPGEPLPRGVRTPIRRRRDDGH
ncbi:hypothetical protein DFJ74DRAFT_693391 [Hyaloraphidium curvatum]|nr:hypothetical protein DFJ74DRAFT_693391 [Hyaloraphidium curvatum]